jgi:hypothetical protein
VEKQMASEEYETGVGSLSRFSRQRGREERLAKFRAANPEFDQLRKEEAADAEAHHEKLMAMMRGPRGGSPSGV